MLYDNLYTGKEAKEALMRGVRKSADAVGGTMGTAGSNAILEAIESPGHLMTNDGYTILSSIQFADPREDMGRKILLEAVSRANRASGDGSSTTTVLTASIMEEGNKHTEEAHPMVIKRSIEDCLPIVEQLLKEQTRQLISDDGVLDYTLLEQVATVSAEDPEIGKTIAGIYTEIGKDGIIHWDISKTAEDSYTIGSGITVEGAKYYSPYMCDATEAGQSTNQIRLKNPLVMITKQKITSASDFNEIGQTLYAKEVRDIVVFCDEIDPLVIPDIIKTRMMRGFRFILVKMPIFWKDEWFEDLSLASGAKIIDPKAGKYLKSVTPDDLGSFGNILITKDDTFIDGIKDLSAHIEALKADDTNEAANRITRLNTKTARYFVGAHSDSALSHRRLKVEDAISAAWQALNGGIVAGGGVALRNIGSLMPDTVGGKIMKEALLSPMRQIMNNAGCPPNSYLGVSESIGFDTKTGKAMDMFEAGIIDPASVVMNAVKNAVSVAASILTANTVIILPREIQPEHPQPPVLR